MESFDQSLCEAIVGEVKNRVEWLKTADEIQEKMGDFSEAVKKVLNGRRVQRLVVLGIGSLVPPDRANEFRQLQFDTSLTQIAMILDFIEKLVEKPELIYHEPLIRKGEEKLAIQSFGFDVKGSDDLFMDEFDDDGLLDGRISLFFAPGGDFALLEDVTRKLFNGGVLQHSVMVTGGPRKSQRDSYFRLFFEKAVRHVVPSVVIGEAIVLSDGHYAIGFASPIEYLSVWQELSVHKRRIKEQNRTIEGLNRRIKHLEAKLVGKEGLDEEEAEDLAEDDDMDDGEEGLDEEAEDLAEDDDMEDGEESDKDSEDDSSDGGPAEKTPAKSALKSAHSAQTSSKKKVSLAPAVVCPAIVAKSPSTPHRSANKKAELVKTKPEPGKTGPVKTNLESKTDLKRKAEDSGAKSRPAVKQARLTDQKSIMSEEERRREVRAKKSLFVKGVSKKMKQSDLKAWHPNILSVRVVGANAWLIFPTESAAEEAFSVISSKKCDGKAVFVDYCGSKSKSDNKSRRSSDEKIVRAVDALRIVVAGLPESATEEQMHTVFPDAKSINVVSKLKADSRMAFLKFDDEQQARDAFEKGASLKIHGSPVDVHYARALVVKEKLKKSKADTPKNAGAEKEAEQKGTVSVKPEKQQQPVSKEDSGDSMEPETDSSEEGIEEGESGQD